MMITRQHATPSVLGDRPGDSVPLTPLALSVGAEGRVDEAFIRDLVFAHPAMLPIAEIDHQFNGAVPICTELTTPAGNIDVLLVTPSGLPVVVECKLWRNPEGRREVVGQILDYAKELTRFSSSDLQRVASQRLKRGGNVILDQIRTAGADVDEAEFNDALTQNLRRGRFLLLIVGDGIREGTEAIADYLQRHAGLHFTLGLVELPIYLAPDGSRFVVPRVLARTTLLTHTVVAVPEGFAVAEQTGATPGDDDVDLDPTTAERIEFWTDFLSGLALDDPDQPLPRPPKQGYVAFGLPAPGGSSWLIVYRNLAKNSVGVFLSYMRGSVGERAVLRVLEQLEAIRPEIEVPIAVTIGKDGRRLLEARAQFTNVKSSDQRAAAIDWLRIRINEFVNAFRPRIRAAVADLSGGLD